MGLQAPSICKSVLQCFHSSNLPLCRPPSDGVSFQFEGLANSQHVTAQLGPIILFQQGLTCAVSVLINMSPHFIPELCHRETSTAAGQNNINDKVGSTYLRETKRRITSAGT